MNLEKIWLAVSTVFALGLSACSGDTADSATTGEGASGAIITTNGSEPRNPLIPADTNEAGGGEILDLISAGPVYYDAEGATHNEVTEEIEPNEDPSVWTITLKKGQKFSNDTEVKVRNFVEAQKKGASGTMLSSFFFEPIQGADEESAGGLTGFEIVSDYTFAVTLKIPTANFFQRLGYSAFAPLPDSTLEDIKKGGENPIGNGPYMVAESDWERSAQIHLIPNPEYKGDNIARDGGMDIIFYTSQDAAYQDLLSGNLGILGSIPGSAFATFETGLSGRSVNQAAAILQSFAIPQKLRRFSGEEGNLRRQALSYAVNRDTITETIFSGTRTPAEDFTSPVANGYNTPVESSEILSYNPEKTKELWAKADAISPRPGTSTIGYNSNGEHQTWVSAATNSVKNTLSTDAVGASCPDFKSLHTEVTNRTITDTFRTGWQTDYPGKYDFITPLYGTGASSNDTDYSSAELDLFLRGSASAISTEKSNKILDRAQEVLLKGLPMIPLWHANVVGGWSEKVDNAVLNWKSVSVYNQVTKKA